MDRRRLWSRARNVLAVRLDCMGDVLMTTPAIRALKEGRRDRRVTLLTSSAAADAARLIPEVDEVLVYDAPWVKATGERPGPAGDATMLDEIRERGFDAAVVFTVYSQNPLPAAMFAYLAGIPLRLAHCRENPYQLLTDWLPEPEPSTFIRHEVRRQLDLVAEIGCSTGDESLSLRVPREAKQRVSLMLDALGLDPRRRLVVVHPGASAASRRYPAESFGRIAADLVAEEDCQVVVSGTADERTLADALLAHVDEPVVSLVGRLDLGELAALLSMADLVVTNNTGPAHIAAALGTPVVDLYALTNPQHAPWAVPSRVLSHDVECKFCYRSVCPTGTNDCLNLIAPEEAVLAARELLAETGSTFSEALALA